MIVGVIGSGSIGPDLAYGFLSSLAAGEGGKVYLLDIKKEALDAGIGRIEGYIGKALDRGRMSQKVAETVRAALVPTMDINDLAACDYVLEAATEDVKIKRVILSNLENVVKADCLIGFATSGIPRKWIAAEAKHPERCFVNHPFYPAWRALPIEVVLSGDESLGARMIDALKKLGKVPIVTADVEGFAADDVFCNYICEAVRIVEEGIATPAQVDKIVNDAIGGGGPFNVMDGTRGNLLVAHVNELMRDAEGGTQWFSPPELLYKQGNNPWHNPQAPGNAKFTEEQGKQVLDRILAVLVGRSFAVAENGVCDPSDLNWLLRMSLGFTEGLLDLGHKLGAERVARICFGFQKTFPEFPVPECIRRKKLISYMRDVKIERDGDIAVVMVNRPELKNALSMQTVQEIKSAFQKLEADATVKGIVFTSYDGALSGADVNEFTALNTREETQGICHKAHPVQKLISELKKPVVAAVNGPVMGGGAEFAMTCHARVVGPNLLFAQPEVNLGIIPGYGATQRLPRIVGIERALELLRTGRSIGAKEACSTGWAYGEPAADFVGAAKNLIRRHLAGEVKLAPVNPAPMKVPDQIPHMDIGHRSLLIDEILVNAVKRGLQLPLDEGLLVEAMAFADSKETVDADIGIKNFTINGPRVPAAFIHE
ncbi:MAG TPA: 3-hydroxyacyl-CoA dehydrogenase/enoyl-CoA hydratase family protein [Acidobacteriota bacterium]|nr:3-hydroxyacyl-CoA dehydrogenase/enoyl-CoA hydratase family protein [Acidobacteriota bacterium]